ncbi:hypothetical protein CGCF413_v010026 [Colletotrichum fructicola]|nr:hypothetical protein CGCF413_v010026 [Colletotrichum fructicola]
MPRLSIEAILALIGLVITVPGAWFAYLQCRSLRQARRTAQLPIWLTDGPINHYTDHMHYQRGPAKLQHMNQNITREFDTRYEVGVLIVRAKGR